MRLEQLVYIVEVAKWQSISKAAKALYVSQPSLSKAISALEDELGSAIFVRHQQGVSLTQGGAAIVERAQVILDEMAAIKSIANAQEDLSGEAVLAVGMPVLLCNTILNKAIVRLNQQYPNLTVLPFQLNLTEMLEGVDSGALDLAIIGYGDEERERVEGEIKAKAMVCLPLSSEDFYVVVGSHSPLFEYKALLQKDMAGLKLVTFSETHTFDETLQNELPLMVRYMPDRESVKQMLELPEYLTVFPRIGAVTDTEVESGHLRAIPLKDFPNKRHISLIFKGNKPIAPYCERFMRIFVDIYSEISKSKS